MRRPKYHTLGHLAQNNLGNDSDDDRDKNDDNNDEHSTLL